MSLLIPKKFYPDTGKTNKYFFKSYIPLTKTLLRTVFRQSFFMLFSKNCIIFYLSFLFICVFFII